LLFLLWFLLGFWFFGQFRAFGVLDVVNLVVIYYLFVFVCRCFYLIFAGQRISSDAAVLVFHVH